MKVKRSQVGWVFWLQWVVASTVGLFVGWMLAFVLLALSGIVLGLGDCDACDALAFGIGLGIGVGVLQWLVLRRRVSGAGWWVLASAAGGYGIWQLEFTGYSDSLEMSYVSLLGWTGVVALGGAVTGTLQWLVLRGQVSRAGWWVLASTVGWGLGVTAAIAFTRFVGDDFGAMVGMGAVLGAVTGGALVWLLRQPVPEA
ncbi:MAG: hypothetical protein WA996_08810 [Candidatus Promineifilaceae bacterium]